MQSQLRPLLPYVSIDALDVTSLRVQRRSSLLLKRFQELLLNTTRPLIYIMYVLFFAWQMIGLVLYEMRAFEATLVAKDASFQSTDIDRFGHSEQLQLIWVISQIFNAWLVIPALSKVPSFLGYYSIFKRLVGLSSFWSLIVLYGMCIVGYLLIIALKNDKAMEMALILAFLSAQGTQVMLIGLLTYTQINHSRKKDCFKVYAFFKLNMFILFLSYFGQFVISSVQFVLHIYGVDEDLGIPSEFLSLIGAIRSLELFYSPIESTLFIGKSCLLTIGIFFVITTFWNSLLKIPMKVIHDLFEQIQLKMFSNRLKRLHFSRKRKLQHVIKLRLLTDKSALINFCT